MTTATANPTDSFMDTAADGVDVGIGSISPNDMPQMISDEIETTTVARAGHYLSINGYEKQRHFIPRRHKELCRKMRDGRFHGSDIAVAKLTFDYHGNDGKVYGELIVNGQHTCKSILDTGIPSKNRIKTFRVENLKQLSVLYGQFDPPGGARTAQQIAHGYTDVLPGWDRREIVQVAGAVVIATRGVKKMASGMSPDEKIGLLFDPEVRPHAEFIHGIVYEEGDRKNHAHLDRQGVMGAMYLTHAVSPDKAFEFWDRVKKGHDLSAQSPGLVLRNFLMKSVSVGSLSGLKARRKGCGTNEFFKRSLQAWNAAASGESLIQFGKLPTVFPKALPWE